MAERQHPPPPTKKNMEEDVPKRHMQGAIDYVITLFFKQLCDFL